MTPNEKSPPSGDYRLTGVPDIVTHRSIIEILAPKLETVFYADPAGFEEALMCIGETVYVAMQEVISNIQAHPSAKVDVLTVADFLTAQFEYARYRVSTSEIDISFIPGTSVFRFIKSTTDKTVPLFEFPDGSTICSYWNYQETFPPIPLGDQDSIDYPQAYRSVRIPGRKQGVLTNIHPDTIHL